MPTRRSQPIRETKTWLGAAYSPTRALTLLELLDNTATTLDDWQLVTVSNPKWQERSCRSDAERRAVLLGESYNFKSGKPRQIFYAVPLTPTVLASELPPPTTPLDPTKWEPAYPSGTRSPEAVMAGLSEEQLAAVHKAFPARRPLTADETQLAEAMRIASARKPA